MILKVPGVISKIVLNKIFNEKEGKVKNVATTLLVFIVPDPSFISCPKKYTYFALLTPKMFSVDKNIRRKKF